MARPLRIEFQNAFYHVINRGLNRQKIYQADDDYRMFLELLKELSGFYGVRIISYCLMPNHYHLLLQTPKANLSRAMRHLNGVYTQRFNGLHKQDGPIFRGRYKAFLVQEDEYLTHLIRYIHLNPVQTNLVKDPKDYPWSSHRDYLKAKSAGDWLWVRLGLAFFSEKTQKAIQQYRQFLKNGIDLQTQSFYSQKRQSPIFGDPDFIEMVKEKYILKDQKISTEIPQKKNYLNQAITDKILKEASRVFGVPIPSLGRSRRGDTNYARLAAIRLTRELSGLTLPAIAELFNMDSYKTAATSVFRAKQRIQTERDFRAKYDRVKLACSQDET